MELNFIPQGQPMQNAFVESSNGKFSDGCLNQHPFRDLDDGRKTIDAWRQRYTKERPHSSLNCTPPARFAQRTAQPVNSR
ncbi:MAG: transposase [Pseudomonadota bacterium]